MRVWMARRGSTAGAAGAHKGGNAGAAGSGGSTSAGGSSDAGTGDAVSGCQTDDECNQGKQRTGIVCSTSGSSAGQCVSGCHVDTDCASDHVCNTTEAPDGKCVAPCTGPTGSDIANLAIANIGQGPCSTNSLGDTSFGSSCTGNGGEPEYWCADFAIWVWSSAGITEISGLTPGAASFRTYGQNNNTLSDTPALGDVAIFDDPSSGAVEHVAVVTQVNSDGTIETVSGDWNGHGDTEAVWAGSAKVVLNSPAYSDTVGSTPSVMSQTIEAYVAPVGVCP